MCTRFCGVLNDCLTVKEMNLVDVDKIHSSQTKLSQTKLWRTTATGLMASSNGNIFRVTGEFPSQRPVTRRFYVFFDLRLNKRLSKRSGRRWFETPSLSLWRQCNGGIHLTWGSHTWGCPRPRGRSLWSVRCSPPWRSIPSSCRQSPRIAGSGCTRGWGPWRWLVKTIEYLKC